MSNALHDYAKLFEKYAAANGGWGVILAGEDCLSLANEMMIDADALEAENAKLRKLAKDLHTLAYSVLPERKSDYITICSVESCIDYYSRTMPSIERRMRELGVEL